MPKHQTSKRLIQTNCNSDGMLCIMEEQREEKKKKKNNVDKGFFFFSLYSHNIFFWSEEIHLRIRS